MDDDRLSALIRAAHGGDPAAELARLRQAIAGGDDVPATLRRAAWLCAALGDTAGAGAYLERARHDGRDRGESCFALGLLRLAANDHEGARHAFLAATRASLPMGEPRARKRAELRAYDSATNALAVFSIFYDQYESAFCCFLLGRAVRPAERQPYDFCVARACTFLGHSEHTAALLQADWEVNGDTSWYHVNMGHYRWLLGEHDAADRHFRAARDISVRDGLTPYHYNCGQLVWLTQAESETLLQPPYAAAAISTGDWTYRFGAPPASTVDVAIVVGCDSNYFVFFPKLLLSILRAHAESGSDATVAVHCHVADPTGEQVAFLDGLSAELRGRAVSVSYSLNAAPFREASYYTCLRFLALPEVMEFYRSAVLVLDIDTELDASFFTRLPEIAGFEAGLRMYSFDPQTRKQVGAEPWSIGADPTYLSGSAITRRFAEFLGRYIAAAYDPGLVTNWTIDQCAVARGYDLLLKSLPQDAVLSFAAFEPITRIPAGSKAEFLRAGGFVGLGDFRQRAAAYLA
jgi:hypothetical protein